MSLSCLGLYHVPSSLACHVYSMLCSILMFLSFVWVSFSHSSCTHHASSFILIHILFFPSFLLIHLSIHNKKGREYTEVFRHFYMTHVHILKGRNSTSCTFIGGESHKGDAYTKGEKTFFYEKTVFCLVLLNACFLVDLWCFELLLVSILCCSHHIVFMCWTCIHFYAIVLYWLHIRMIICFAIWSL